MLHEWQTQRLAAASATNAQLEGDVVTPAAATVTVRLSNTCQISNKVPAVSGTQQAVNPAGRDDEFAYQVTLNTLELRRDIETTLMDNNAEVTGATTTARETGGIESWINTNTSVGVGGTAGSLGNTARVNGTNRTWTETLLKAQLINVFNNGGDPNLLMMPADMKQATSAFTGNATRMINADDKKLQAAIDIYQGDFGDMEIIPNRFMETDSVLILQTDLWATAWLRRPRMVPMGRVGDTEWAMIVAEYCLESRNERGSGAVFDVQSS